MSVPEKLEILDAEKNPGWVLTGFASAVNCGDRDLAAEIVKRYNAYAEQQTEIERLKIENAELLNLASGWRNEAIDKKQQIADQQTLIKQLSEACKKGSEELGIWLSQDDCDCPSDGHVCGRPRVIKSKEQLDVAVAAAQNRTIQQ